MVAEIIQIGHPTLRQKARALTEEEILSEDIQRLISLMCETMRQAPGVGLAAPQINHSLQIIVIEDKIEYTAGATKEQLELKERKPVPLHILINPKIFSEDIEQKEFFEGCMSVEGFVSIVPRLLTVTVKALNERAEPVTITARGWFARILQHEIDHLNGILCIDHSNIRTLMTTDNYLTYWKDTSISEILK